MKYLIVIGDGMADRPLAELGNKTLLDVCRTPHLDALARKGCGGLVQTIPASCEPGSDVANLSILGYDPAKYYTGRAPLEAVSMGILLKPRDIAFRCNLVTVEENRLVDYCADHISTQEAKEVITYLRTHMDISSAEFHPGVSYRHLLVYRNGPAGWRKGTLKTTPPHDFTGKDFLQFLPQGEDAQTVVDLMERSREVLAASPLTKKRAAQKKNPANMVWLWGQGGAVSLPSIPGTYGIQGTVISAVDLVRGIGACAALDVELVPGATGFIDTNYAGKVKCALSVLKKKDFVFLHIEAPDEAGHSGNWKIKQQAIEDFDSKVVGPLIAGMEGMGPYRMLVMPDHATPVELKTHSREAVPFVMYPAIGNKPDAMTRFTEAEAAKGAYQITEGHTIFKLLIKGSMD